MRKPVLLSLAGLLVVALGILGYLRFQNGLVSVPLTEGAGRFVAAAPEYGEDQAILQVVLPPGPRTDAFLSRQAALPLIQPDGPGGWLGVLAQELAVSRHGRRLRLRLRPGWRLQGGGVLDAERLRAFWAPRATPDGFQVTVEAADSLEVRFQRRPASATAWLAQWQIPGTGPFSLRGTTLHRFDGFIYGKAGIAEVQVLTDPAFRESHAWADGLAAGRWAWAAFPEAVAPEDMARVRTAPYDELRMKDGTVWFLSRRMRRLRPDPEDWTRTRLFGAWRGSMDLPYDPLGL